jgi:predicted secreted hydrolase
MTVIPSDSRLPGREGSAGTRALAAISVLLALAALLLPPSRHSPRGIAPGGPRLELGPGPGLKGFARATAVRPFVLPADHGPHLEYQTEWWYYTGNLSAADGRHFGFQLTFFRRGFAPGPSPEGAGLSAHHVYFTHLAITDVAARRHVVAERFSRGAGGLAGATAEPFAVWLEDWRADALDRDGSAVRVVARDAASGLSLDLELRATKPLVAHGDRGLSPKSDEPGNASYYVSYTRLSARGRIGTGGDEAEVAGEAWFDHEWSTSALGPGAVGWDWFSLQLDDQRELMLFRIRREDGSIEPASGGTLVERDGRSRRLAREDVWVDVLDHWTSPQTGARYPSRWRVQVPSDELDLVVEPWLEDQEMRTSFVYWEGTVRVSGASGGRLTTGQGYAELTGYARSMQGVF